MSLTPLSNRLLAGSLLALTAASPACTLHDVKRDPPPRVEVPEAFSSPAGDGAAVERWWTDFGDAELSRMVDTVLGGNLDLKRAWARLNQMTAVARMAGSARYPQIDAAAAVSYAWTPVTGDLAKVPGFDDRREQASYQISVGVAYEVDLWGRVASNVRAAEADVEASREDISTIAMTMAAQTVELWYSLAQAQAQKELVLAQLEVNKRFLELVELRFEQGFANAVSLYQQRQQVAATEARLPLIDAQVEVARHQLAVLAGKPPQALDVTLPSALPEPPPLPRLGLPSELLARRPDVRAAQLRVVAADHRVGAAIADQYPALRLSASGGLQDTDLAEMLTSWFVNLAANLVAPLFDGGRRSAEVDRTRAVVEERVHAYGQTVLTAFKEVEDALVQERQQREHIKRLDAQIALARATLEEARARYVNGLSDYLPVLTALSTLQQVELGQLGARRQLLSQRVQLLRALGGTWTRELTPATARIDDARPTPGGGS